MLMDLQLGLKTAESYYNEFNQRYETNNHIYIPDLVGYADGRIVFQVDNDKVEFNPYTESWKLNHESILLSDILDKISEETPIFWACFRRCVGSENTNFDFDRLINIVPEYKSEKKEKVWSYESLEENAGYCIKPLESLLGKLTYTHTIDGYHLFNTEKYGKVRISIEDYRVQGKDYKSVFMEDSEKFPKTWKLVHDTFSWRTV